MARTTDPTIKANWKARIIAYSMKADAQEEAALWRESGHKVKIILRRNVYNLVITQ